jgi:hypothetical protein
LGCANHVTGLEEFWSANRELSGKYEEKNPVGMTHRRRGEIKTGHGGRVSYEEPSFCLGERPVEGNGKNRNENYISIYR